MAKARLPLLTSNDPEAFPLDSLNGATATVNAMYDQYPDGRPYATQRPGIEVLTDASEETIKTRGRGVRFWQETSATYFVNDDTIFKDDYSTSIGTISSGKQPVWFGELGGKLVILDQENDEGWTVDSGDTLAAISGANWPSTLAGGGAVLDKTLYVMDEDGLIYGSDLNAPTFTDALNVIEAEREPDPGLYLGKMLDQVVAFGTKTIEFFYDAANPTGSPLSRRSDVSYRIGSIDPTSFYNSSNVIYFIASDVSGSLSFYKMENFQMQKLSNPTIDSAFDNAVITNSNQLVVSGALAQGHLFILLTEMDASGTDFDPQRTFCFDATMGTWTTFKTDILDITEFPVVFWSERLRGDIRFGTGIFSNGDIIKFKTDGTHTDEFNPSEYFEPNYIETSYYSEAGDGSSVGVDFTIRTGEFDNGHQNNKVQHKLTIVGGITRNSSGTDPLLVRWTDDHYNTFSSDRSVTMSKQNYKVARGGIFNRRAYELSYSGTDKLRLEAIELDFSESHYA